MLLPLFFISSFMSCILAVKSFNYDSRQNLAVYWGQNTLNSVSGGSKSEQNLTDYCSTTDVNIVLLSFLNKFPGTNDIPTLIMHGEEYSNTYQHELSGIANDISYCQSQGKIVLLSLGGQGGDYGFNSDLEAQQFADQLWNLFGEGQLTSGLVRPFGDVKIDGFDLDIESNSSVGMEALGTALKSKFDSGSKKYYLSAAPQCPYPEQALGGVLNGTHLDFAFIQFYNNALNCDANTDRFNWNTWAQWAEGVSVNKEIKLFMGIPGSLSSAVSGYFDNSSDLKNKVELASGNSTFGGVMIWDASTAEANTNINSELYIKVVKDTLQKDLSDHYWDKGVYEKVKSAANVSRSIPSLIALLASTFAVVMF